MTTSTYNRAFWNAMRGQEDAYGEMREGADGSGGHMVPDTFADKFTAALERENLFRRFAMVVRSYSGDGKIHAVASTGNAEWVEENQAIPESADAFAVFPVEAFKLAAMSRIKRTFVSDTEFDLEGYLCNEFALRFGRAEEAAFIGGDGVNRPTGILTGGTVGVTTAGAAEISFDEVTGLYFSLKAEYRKNAVWLMNDETALRLRLLKDSAGRYLWRDSDDTIYGKPVLVSPYMPTMAAGAKAVAFGDLSHYWIVERQALAVKRLSELYSLEELIGFSAHERLDGRLIFPEAVKILQVGG